MVRDGGGGYVESCVVIHFSSAREQGVVRLYEVFFVVLVIESELLKG